VPDLPSLTIAGLARLIMQSWRDKDGNPIVYFGAVPYLNAMLALNSIHDRCGYDDGRSIVVYFLSNANTWRGPVAKAIKAELNRRLKAQL